MNICSSCWQSVICLMLISSTNNLLCDTQQQLAVWNSVVSPRKILSATLKKFFHRQITNLADAWCVIYFNSTLRYTSRNSILPAATPTVTMSITIIGWLFEAAGFNVFSLSAFNAEPPNGSVWREILASLRHRHGSQVPLFIHMHNSCNFLSRSLVAVNQGCYM